MRDADDSYDFANLDDFVTKLHGGYDLVMGNRFRGGILPGAMPVLHRYLGNPLLSLIGRLFFKVKIADFTAACAALIAHACLIWGCTRRAWSSRAR